jgi:hypothetical protein
VARAAAICLARRSGWQITDSVPWSLLDSAIAQHDQDRSHTVSIIFFSGKLPSDSARFRWQPAGCGQRVRWASSVSLFSAADRRSECAASRIGGSE